MSYMCSIQAGCLNFGATHQHPFTLSNQPCVLHELPNESRN